MTSPMTSPLRGTSPTSPKVSSSFSSRKAESLRSKLEEELLGRASELPLPCFLEHMLSAPETVTNQWDSYLDELEKEAITITLKNAFTGKFNREVECYMPFVALVNHILERANSKFPPGPEAVPSLKFCASNSKTIKGDARTPTRFPDVVLAEEEIVKERELNPKTNLHWHHVLVPFEFKVKKKLWKATESMETVSPSPGSSVCPSPSPGKRKAETLSPIPFKRARAHHRRLMTKNQIQVADYAHEMLASTNGTRMHSLAVFVDDNLLRLWYYDRGGGLCTANFIDIENDFKTFMKVIMAITRLRLTAYGFFPIFDWPPGPAVPHSLEGASLTLHGHKITLTDLISTRPGLVTRASQVWGVKCLTLPGELVVKISFQQTSRTNEVDIIKYAEAHGVDHLPVVYAWKDFGKVSEGVRSRLSQDTQTNRYDDRILRVIVFKRYTPVYGLKSPLSEFKNVIRDVFECMVQLHEKAGILHRDISHTNIMAEETDDGSFHGILNDFDLAVRMNNPDLDSLSFERTGTLPFMAVALLRHPSPQHLFSHDVESIFYVLVWIAVQYNQDGKFVSSEQLTEWTTDSFKQMRRVKKEFLEEKVEELELMDFYEGVEEWIGRLANVILGLYQKTQGTNRYRMDMLKEVLGDAFYRSPLSRLSLAIPAGQDSVTDEGLITTVRAIMAA